MRLTRRGGTLLELLVAATLFLVAASVATRALRAGERQQRAFRAVDLREHVLDQLVGVTGQALAERDPVLPVRLLADTGIAFGLPVGHTPACAGAGDTILLPRSGRGAWWSTEPDSGDLLTIDHADGGSDTSTIRAVHGRAASGHCPDGAWHLSVEAATPGATAQAFLRIARPVRHVLYRGSDGTWWWGERHCRGRSGAVCGPAQPLAGPFLRSEPRVVWDSANDLILISPRSGDGERRFAVPLGGPR
jgi:hypothetical protein